LLEAHRLQEKQLSLRDCASAGVDFGGNFTDIMSDQTKWRGYPGLELKFNAPPDTSRLHGGGVFTKLPGFGRL